MMRARNATTRGVWAICFVLLGNLMVPIASHAATAQAIDAAADKTLEEFKTKVKGADALLRTAKGYLVFPEVIQAGIGIGGEYGEGALRVDGKNVAYFSLTAGSIGFQLGAQRKSIIVIFLSEQALREFQAKTVADKAWTVGIDGSIALLNLGAEASVDAATINQPVVGFVLNQAGLMYNLSLQGAKVTRIQR
jgi:lipid-binding SYLF domain-containing protein